MAALNPVEYLRAFQARKRMYIQPVDVASVGNFLTGFRTGLYAAGLDPRRYPWHDTIERRGWLYQAFDPADVMRERGLDDEAIMDELIEIEILGLEMLAEEGT